MVLISISTERYMQFFLRNLQLHELRESAPYAQASRKVPAKEPRRRDQLSHTQCNPIPAVGLARSQPLRPRLARAMPARRHTPHAGVPNGGGRTPQLAAPAHLVPAPRSRQRKHSPTWAFRLEATQVSDSVSVRIKTDKKVFSLLFLFDAD
jgi:hypothetical protein